METEKETCTRPKWMTKLLGCAKQGGISSQQLPTILTELNPGLKNVDETVLNRLIKQNDPDGSGVLDFDTVTKILFQLILKQPCQDENEMEGGDAFSPMMGTDNMLVNNSTGGGGFNSNESDCSCNIPGSCTAMKITDFIIFPTF